MNEYTVVIKQESDYWIGWVEEIPGVNCREAPRRELLETLKMTLKEALDLNRKDAIAEAGQDFHEERIAV